MLRVYMEPDKDEVFNTVNWGFDGQGGPLLAAGGVKGVVRIIYCNQPTLNSVKGLIGHSEYGEKFDKRILTQSKHE